MKRKRFGKGAVVEQIDREFADHDPSRVHATAVERAIRNHCANSTYLSDVEYADRPSPIGRRP